jgi:cell division inhibitor SulA
MPKYVIERRIAGAGSLTAADLQGIAARSCAVLNELGPSIQWLESQVTDDTVYCLYIAPDETLLREHARRGGFPADRIARVRATIDPSTAC